MSETTVAQPESVRAKHTATNRVATVSYNFGEDLDAMIERFGKDVVYSNAKQAIRISLQTRMRSAMDEDPEADPPKVAATDEALQADADAWKPGVASGTRKTTAEKAADLFSKLSPEEKAALLASIGDE